MGYRFIAPINLVEHGPETPADDPVSSRAAGDSFNALSPAASETSNDVPVPVPTSESLPISHIFLVSADGGRPRQLGEIGPAAYPSWSPDGKSLIFADGSLIRELNLQTGSVEPVPGSRSLGSPRISPDGRWIAAVSKNWDKLLVFDTHARVWKELAQSPFLGWLQWSADSEYLYFAPFESHRQASESHLEVSRIRVEGGKLEQVVTMKNYRTAGFAPGWFSVTPDGDLLLLHDTGSGTEIYALSWDAP